MLKLSQAVDKLGEEEIKESDFTDSDTSVHTSCRTSELNDDFEALDYRKNEHRHRDFMRLVRNYHKIMAVASVISPNECVQPHIVLDPKL